MFQKIRHWVSSVFTTGALSFGQPTNGFGHSTNADKTRPFYSRLRRQNRPYAKLRLDSWNVAVQMAENIEQPRRETLLDLYKSSLNDETLLSEIRKAHIMVQRAPFTVERRGKENEDAKDLFMRPWFKVFLRHWLDAEFWGHSLIEFNPVMKDGEFQSVELIPREHVRPECGEVVYDINAISGLSIETLQTEYGIKLIPVGEPFDLGLLKVASKAVIIKNYSTSDWSQFNEKFGMPLTVVKTSSRNEEELNQLEKMAANMGASGYGIFDEMDVIEFHERKNQASHKTYEDLISRKDNDLAKLINGQTGTSDEKSFVGAAQVHERVLNDYTFARLSQCQDFINFTLMPFLNDNGYKFNLKWDKFIFTELINKALGGGDKPKGNNPNDTPPPPPAPKGGNEPQKKKPNAQLIFDAPCCEQGGFDHATLSFDLSSLFEKAIRKIFDKKIKAGDIDAKLWKATATQLTKGVTEGFGTEYKDDTDLDLSNQLKYNVSVFAAFKNHAQNLEMVEALTDASGLLKSYEAFKADAMKILTTYNDNWLKAEYDTAVSSAQMAVQWNDFQRDKTDFPNLMYVTAGDERVRKAHAALDGVTLPMDDPFWKEWFPPNGWRCRCDVQQIGANAKLKEPKSLPDEKETPLSFRNNAGITGEVFTAEHPYISGLSDEQRQNVQTTVDKLLKKGKL